MGSPKVTLGSPTVSPFLYKCRRLRRNRGFFPELDMKSDIVRRTTFFCNKESLFACWKKSGGTLKCYAVDCRKMKYFVFSSFVSINCEIVLTLGAYVLV